MTHSAVRSRSWFVGAGVAALVIPWATVQASRAIHEHAAVDAQGSIEIVNVAGVVDLSGWNRPEIEVTGTAGDGVDRVEVTTSADRASVTVVSRSGVSFGDDHEAHLTIHVPLRSVVKANLVSCNLKLSNLQGETTLQTVSGDVVGRVDGDLHAHTVSGNVHLDAPGAKRIEVGTVSGEIVVTGAGGEVEFTTISGDMKVNLVSVTRGRFKSVSGDLTAGFALADEGEIQGESVSGGLTFNLASVPAAKFDVQTLSGDITNCFGPKALESRYGPGSRLEFKNGDGSGRVRVETKSGDVRLCAANTHGDHTARADHNAWMSAKDCVPQIAAPAAVSLVASREHARLFHLL